MTRVLSPDEAGRSQQAQARELVMECNGERHLPFPVWVDGRRCGRLQRAADVVGAQSTDILAWLGLSEAEVAALHANGAVHL